MANEKKYSNTTVATSVSNADLILITANTSNTAVSRVVTAATLLGNSAVTIKANSLVIKQNTIPANSTATTIPKGTIWIEGNYLYYANGDNNVVRANLNFQTF